MLAQAGTEAATRFEQTSGPVMAKGVEDSAYYRWARFVALNEVGGDPARFGSTVEEFHAAQQRRAERYPAVDDDAVDARHQAQRGRPGPAGRAGRAARASGRALVRWLLDRHPLADRPLAHLVWQNLVGAWPLSRERAHAYVEKAAREAGTSTTWTDPDEEFEGQLHALVDAAFDDAATHAEIEEFVDRIAPFGWSNSLSQKLLQLTMPGVPDVYQGTELWDFSLVDPDNRRPVDYALRRELLAALDGGEVPAVDETGRGQAAGGLPGAAGPAGPPGVVRRVRAGRGHRLGGRPRGRVRPRRRRRGRDPAAGAAWPRDGWGDTALQLPNGAWRDLLTGERFVSDVAGVAADAAAGPAAGGPARPRLSRGRVRTTRLSARAPALAADHAGGDTPGAKSFGSAGRVAETAPSVVRAPGPPGRARGAGPPNPVRRRLTPTHPGRGRGTHFPTRTRVLG